MNEATQAQAQALSALRAMGRNPANAGLLDVKPLVLQNIITYEMGATVTEQIFFETGRTIPKAFTGQKTFPGGFQNEYVRIDRVEILPRIALAVLEATGTDEDAYHYYITGTQVKFKVDNVEVFEAPLFMFLPHRSVGNGQGTDVLVSKTTDFSVKLPEPIEIPAGSNLTVVITPPNGLTTAAAAATNSHYPGVNVAGSTGSTARSCALHFYGHGVTYKLPL